MCFISFSVAFILLSVEVRSHPQPADDCWIDCYIIVWFDSLPNLWRAPLSRCHFASHFKILVVKMKRHKKKVCCRCRNLFCCFAGSAVAPVYCLVTHWRQQIFLFALILISLPALVCFPMCFSLMWRLSLWFGSSCASPSPFSFARKGKPLMTNK